MSTHVNVNDHTSHINNHHHTTHLQQPPHHALTMTTTSYANHHHHLTCQQQWWYYNGCRLTMRVGFGLLCPAPHKGISFFHYLLSFIDFIYVQLTWQGGFPPCQPSPWRSPTHAEHRTTPSLMWFHVQHVFYALPHAEHITTLRWCDFVFSIFSLPCICWTQNNTLVCVFSWLASFLWPYPCWAQNHTNEGVISCLASFICPPTYAEHVMTASLVSFCAQILFYPLEWALRVFIKYFIYY